MNEIYASQVGSTPPARSTVEVAKLPVRRARRDRGDRPRLGRLRSTSARSGWTRTSSAARCATSCSGTTPRTPTSSFPGSTSTACAPRSSRTAGPRSSSSRADRSASASTPATRRCASSCARGSSWRRRGARSRPGPAGTTSRSSSIRRQRVEEDLARRDFTVNAMARRLADDTLVDPYGGRADLAGEDAAHRLAVQLRRGSAATRARSALRLTARARSRRADARADARGGGERRARLGRADRRRPRSRRDGGALEAAARRASRRRRCGSRATRAFSCTCCPSSSPRSASSRRAAGTR